LRIFDAATICIALVICAVLRTDLMRRRMSRVLAIVKRAKGEGRRPKQNQELTCKLQLQLQAAPLSELSGAGVLAEF